MAQFITDFGDQAILLPLTLAIGLFFLLSGWRRGAVAWLGVIGCLLATMFVFKVIALAYVGCWTRGEMRSPSGHTAAATVVFGGLLSIGLRRSIDHARMPLVCAIAVAVLIGVTRVILEVHTVPEVIAGGLVGAVGVVSLTKKSGRAPPTLRLDLLAAMVFVLTIELHGFRLPAEDAIRRIGSQI